MAAHKQDPQTALLKVLEQYRETTELHPAVSVLSVDNGFKETFSRVVQQDYDIIISRSQDLDDHEITITQKAFTILMQNESDHQAAIQLYVEELLGIKSSTVSGFSSTIRSAIQVKAAFLEECETHTENHARRDATDGQQHEDEKLLRLESLCEQAKADFESSGSARYDKASTARFLRDTVENTIIYIRSSKLADPGQVSCYVDPGYEEKLETLEQLYKEAAIAARDAHRGEPRAFEKSSANLVPQRQMQRRTPISKRRATEPRPSALRLGKHEVSGVSSSFPPASLPRRAKSRSASPRKVPDHTGSNFRRHKGMHGDRYRPA